MLEILKQMSTVKFLSFTPPQETIWNPAFTPSDCEVHRGESADPLPPLQILWEAVISLERAEDAGSFHLNTRRFVSKGWRESISTSPSGEWIRTQSAEPGSCLESSPGQFTALDTWASPPHHAAPHFSLCEMGKTSDLPEYGVKEENGRIHNPP